MSMNEFLLSSVVVFVIFFGSAYMLKKKWELPKETHHYSDNHRRIHHILVTISIILMIAAGFWGFENNLNFPFALIPLTMFFILEIIRIYMLKKYEENPKWIVISAIQLVGIGLILGLLVAATFTSTYFLG